MTKVLLINDTSSELHHGCNLVTEVIKENLHKRNIKKIKSILSGKRLRSDKNILKKLKDFQLILVNGEGTLNNSQKRAKNLILDVIYLKKILNIPVILINATIYKNNTFIMENMKLFDLIFVRCSLDQKELKKVNIFSTIVPDLTFYKEFKLEKIKKSNKFLSLTDCYKDKISEKILIFSKNNNINFLPIRTDSKAILPFNFNFYNFLKYKIKNFLIKIISIFYLDFKYKYKVQLHYTNKLIDYLQKVKNSHFLICGRFHAVCFALKTLTPFYVLNSTINSHKYIGLAKDIGIEKRMVNLNDLKKKKLIFYSKKEIKLINAYVLNAKYKIENMFEEIFKLIKK